MIYTRCMPFVECKILHTYNVFLRETDFGQANQVLRFQPVREGSFPADPSKNMDPTTIL